MSPIRTLIRALAPLAVSGCAIATPFDGPAIDPSKDAAALIVVTEATLKPNHPLRGAFANAVEAVEASLDGQPGFLGLSKRVELLGDRRWTMTAWESEGDMLIFMYGRAHQDAIDASYAALAAERFARFTLPAAQFPPRWDDALAALDAQQPIPKTR